MKVSVCKDSLSVAQFFDFISRRAVLNSDRMAMCINGRKLIVTRIRPIGNTSLRNGKMKEITDDQGKQVQQLAALERVMKKQERDTRAE